MRRRLTRTVLPAALMIAALCGPTAEAADYVFTHGRIFTVDDTHPWAQALVVDHGQIVYVGDDAGAAPYATGATHSIDLKGRVMLPGLHDVHMHPLEASNPAGGDCQLTKRSDLIHLSRTLGDCMNKPIGVDWVTGWGFSGAALARLPGDPADRLEAAIPGRPAIFMEQTSHSEWLNRTALKRAGITRDTPNPPGGLILHDRKGEPTGVLLDNAGDMVLDQVFQETPQLLDLAYQGLVAKLQEFPALGLTSIADARVYWRRGHDKVWRRIADEGKLPVRVVLDLWAYPQLGDEQLQDFARLHSDDPNSYLRVTQIKFYSDGLVENATARMKDLYEPGQGRPEIPHGLNYFDKDRLARYLEAIEPMGFDAHIHAIGDLGVAEALDAIETAEKVNGSLGRARHRITHIEIADEKDLPRFAKLGVVADFQVAGDWSEPRAYYALTKPYIGERARNPMPLRQVYDSGAVVTLSSDYDVSDPNPFIGMSHALTRGRESLPTVAAAVRAYTLNGAYALREESRVGSLEVGKRADLIVLDRDIFQIPKPDIAKTRVLLTLMDGHQTYRAPGF